MVMVCPQCEWSSASDSECPECHVPLRPHGPGSARRAARAAAWHTTPQGRSVLTALIAAGLCCGLLQLADVLLRATDPDHGGAVLDQATGYAVFAAMQVLALLAAGLVVGAGCRQPAGAGATMGLLSGLLVLTGLLSGVLGGLARSFVPDPLAAGGSFHRAVFYGLPALQAACGAAGSWLGHCIWKPPPVITMAILRSAGPTPGLDPSGRASRFWAPWSGPVAWLRVITGTFVAVCGGVCTRTVIEFAMEASDGYFRILTDVQSRVTTGEVFSLSILLGGCVAGATTRNGLKQGFCVGAVAGLILTVFFVTGLIDPAGSAFVPTLAAGLLGPLGGWFGSELIPPGDTRRRRKSWLDDAPPTAMS